MIKRTKTLLQRLRNRNGAAMSAVVLSTCVIGGSMVIAGIAATTHQWSRGVRNLSDHARAQAIAEAGVMEAYVRLSQDRNRAADPNAFQTVAFGGGSYLNTVSIQGDDDDYVVVASQGTFRDATATATVVYRDSGDTIDETITDPVSGVFEDDDIPVISGPGPVSPFQYAVLVGGTISWGGTAGGGAPGAWVHGNQQVTVYGNGRVGASVSSAEGVHTQGGACQIEEDAHAPQITGQPQVKVSGTAVTGPVAAIPVPQINFEPYRAWAQAHGEFFSGQQQISSDYEPTGGILFVEGDLHLNGGNLKGCFVATGDIHVNAQVRHTRIEGLPSLMTDSGTIKMNGGAVLEGLIYARTGNLDKLNGNATLRGSIIAGGYMETNGTFDFEFVDSTPNPPWQVTGGGGSGGEWTSPGDADYDPSPATWYLAAWQD